MSMHHCVKREEERKRKHVLKEGAAQVDFHFHRGVSTTTTTITSHEGLCRWWESQRKIPVGLCFSLKLCYTQLPQEAKKGRPVAATAALTSSPPSRPEKQLIAHT